MQFKEGDILIYLGDDASDPEEIYEFLRYEKKNWLDYVETDVVMKDDGGNERYAPSYLLWFLYGRHTLTEVTR